MGGKGGKIVAKTARCAARLRPIPARSGAFRVRLREMDGQGWPGFVSLCGCSGACGAGWRRVDRTNLPQTKLVGKGGAWGLPHAAENEDGRVLPQRNTEDERGN